MMRPASDHTLINSILPVRLLLRLSISGPGADEAGHPLSLPPPPPKKNQASTSMYKSRLSQDSPIRSPIRSRLLIPRRSGGVLFFQCGLHAPPQDQSGICGA